MTKEEYYKKLFNASIEVQNILKKHPRLLSVNSQIQEDVVSGTSHLFWTEFMLTHKFYEDREEQYLFSFIDRSPSFFERQGISLQEKDATSKIKKILDDIIEDNLAPEITQKKGYISISKTSITLFPDFEPDKIFTTYHHHYNNYEKTLQRLRTNSEIY